MAELKQELGGELENAILGLMMTQAEFDAKELKEAMKASCS